MDAVSDLVASDTVEDVIHDRRRGFAGEAPAPSLRSEAPAEFELIQPGNSPGPTRPTQRPLAFSMTLNFP